MSSVPRTLLRRSEGGSRHRVVSSGWSVFSVSGSGERVASGLCPEDGGSQTLGEGCRGGLTPETKRQTCRLDLCRCLCPNEGTPFVCCVPLRGAKRQDT